MNQIVTARLNNDFFIQEKDIKIHCPISANIADGQMYPSISIAQNLYIKKNLTTKLYDELLNEWIASGFNPQNLPDNTQSVNGVNYKELYQKMYLPLVWRAYVLFIADGSIKLEEKGLMINSADYSENTGVNDVFRVQKQRELIAGELMDEFLCYLKDTFKDNPNYDFHTKQTPQNGGFNSGIFFPNQQNKCKKC